MMTYLVQRRNQTFVEGYEFLSFAKNINKKQQKQLGI